MSIKELEKELQRKDTPLTQREHDKTVYNVWKSKDEITSAEGGTWQKIKDKMFGERLRAITIGGIVIFVITFISLATVSFVYFQSGFFDNERVTFAIEMPKNIGSNTLTEIEFTYYNHNRASLNNAQIIVQFGKYFIPVKNQASFKYISNSQGIITLGEIKGNEKKSVKLAGHFVGPANSVNDIAGILRYTPERTSVKYEIVARGATTITSSPITIDIKAPQEVVSGNLIDIAISVKNSSDSVMSNLKLVIDIPQNFSMYNSTPNPIIDKTWFIDEISPRDEYTMHLRGGLKAAIGTTQVFNIEVGTQEGSEEYVQYASGKYAPYMIGSPIIIQQSAGSSQNDVVYAGDKLRYDIKFINNSTVPLREAIVSVKFSTNVLDFAQLDLENKGDYDPKTKTIIWKASDVPKLQLLKPNESGEISFVIPVVNKLPVNNERDYNFSVTTLVAIDSKDIPSELRENKTVLSNVLTKKVGAKVLLGSNIKYIDGALPPKIGEKTKYTVTLAIDNINNDIDNAVITILLPTHVNFISGKDVVLNERTNEVTWNVGKIVHGTGVLSDPVVTSFDIEIVPSIDQVNKSPLLLQQQVLTAKDVFTGVDIKKVNDNLTTGDIINEQIPNQNQGTVQP